MAKIRSNCVSVDVLRTLISYNPETGSLVWLPRNSTHFSASSHSAEHQAAKWNSRWAGTPALAALEVFGYGHGDIMGKRYKAHRVAWALHHGEWPETGIDHINGNPADNRIENLRAVPHRENMRNQRLSSANKSGVIGVCWARHREKWSAQIKVNGRKVHLGLFSTVTAAAAARKAAEREYGFHANHGRSA